MTRLGVDNYFLRKYPFQIKTKGPFAYIQTAHPIEPSPLVKDVSVADFITRIKNLYSKYRFNSKKWPLDKLLNYIMPDGQIDEKLKETMLKIIGNKDWSPFDINKYVSSVASNDYSPRMRRRLLKLFKDVMSQNPLKTFTECQELGGFIKKQLEQCNDEDELNSLFKKIRSILLSADSSEETCSYVQNWCHELPLIAGEDFSRAMLKGGIVPTDGITKAMKDNPLAIKSLLKLLISPKNDLLNLDEIAVTKILNNTDSKIRDIIMKRFCETQNRNISMKIDAFNPSQYIVKINDSAYLFKLNTERLIAESYGDYSDLNICNHLNNTETRRKYSILNGYGTLESRVMTHKKSGEKTYFQQSFASAEPDVIRVNDDKIEILSRSFADPITGEMLVRQNLKSPHGTEIQRKFLEHPDGGYDYLCSIKDNKGLDLFNREHTYRIIDENNFVSTVNENVYETSIKGDLLSVKSRGVTTTLNLKDLVPSGNKKIINMLASLPGDELIKLKNSGIKRIEESDSSGYIDNVIRLADGDLDDAFVFLHEFGHKKAKKLDDSTWNKILSIYHKELAFYRKNVTSLDMILIRHVIDCSNHYLNSRHGTIEEVLADTNALLKTYSKDRDLSERIITLLEMFPETMAEISKYI